MVLLLGSYPPRECGIATFMHDVKTSFDGAFSTRTDVIAIDEPGGEARRYPPAVVARLQEQDHYAYPLMARFIDNHPADYLNIQHEYGLFGGERGEWIIDLLDRVTKPVVLTLHTVLPEPDDAMLARHARTLRRSASASFRSRRPAAICSSALRHRSRTSARDPSRRSRRAVHDTTDAAKPSFGIGQRMVDLDLRVDQSRQRSRVRDRSDARRRQAPSRSALPYPR